MLGVELLLIAVAINGVEINISKAVIHTLLPQVLTEPKTIPYSKANALARVLTMISQ